MTVAGKEARHLLKLDSVSAPVLYQRCGERLGKKRSPAPAARILARIF
jgi:hypothetical protein